MTASLQLPLVPDPQLTAVADELLALDHDGARIARVLRRTYDMPLNGKDTGPVPLGSAAGQCRR
jgi:hypothetical protein